MNLFQERMDTEDKAELSTIAQVLLAPVVEAIQSLEQRLALSKGQAFNLTEGNPAINEITEQARAQLAVKFAVQLAASLLTASAGMTMGDKIFELVWKNAAKLAAAIPEDTLRGLSQVRIVPAATEQAP